MGYCSVPIATAGIEVDHAVVEDPEVMVGEAHANLPLERVGNGHVGCLDPARRAVRSSGQVHVQPVLVLVEREQRAREQVFRLLRQHRHRLAVAVGRREDGDVLALRCRSAERDASEIRGDVRAGIKLLCSGGAGRPGRRGAVVVAPVRECDDADPGHRDDERHDSDGCPHAPAAERRWSARVRVPGSAMCRELIDRSG